MSDYLFVKISAKEFNEILSALKKLIYGYNTEIKNYGIYLKPYHVVYYGKKREYYYVGKYWFKLYYKNGKTHWLYLGSKKPLTALPDPPNIPHISIIKHEENFFILQQDLEKLRKFIESEQSEKPFS